MFWFTPSPASMRFYLTILLLKFLYLFLRDSVKSIVSPCVSGLYLSFFRRLIIFPTAQWDRKLFLARKWSPRSIDRQWDSRPEIIYISKKSRNKSHKKKISKKHVASNHCHDLKITLKSTFLHLYIHYFSKNRFPFFPSSRYFKLKPPSVKLEASKNI